MAKYPGSETWYLYRGAPPEFKGIESLPEDERNTIALAAAKTLAFRDYPEGMTPAQWADYLEKKWHNWIPEETGIKKWSAELLHSLSETRLLTTPEVFPYLIEGLRHPSGSVYSPCWQALSLLTQHRSGWRTFHEAYGTNALAMRQQCLTWWQEWWAENKNKSPIFDRAIEERTRHAFWRVTKELEKLKTEFPELAFYQAPRFYQAPEERKGSAWTFSVDDFQDIGAFAGKLTTRADAVSAFLYRKLSAKTRQALEKYQGARSDTGPLQEALAHDLNLITKGELIYNAHRFARVTTLSETKELLARRPQGEDLIRLNRLLLEEAYPREISRDRSYVRFDYGNPLFTLFYVTGNVCALEPGARPASLPRQSPDHSRA